MEEGKKWVSQQAEEGMESGREKDWTGSSMGETRQLLGGAPVRKKQTVWAWNEADRGGEQGQKTMTMGEAGI